MDFIDTDGRLDFEFEDPLLNSGDDVANRRKKIIGLDDLLADYYFKEQSKVIERRQSKRAEALKDHDPNENRQEVMVKSLEECEFKSWYDMLSD